MKPLIFSLFILSVSPQAHALNYFRCETTKDCAKAYGGCGRYLSVHKRYKELYEAKAHKADKTSNCLPPTAADKKRKFDGVISCIKQSCRLKIPKEKSKAAG